MEPLETNNIIFGSIILGLLLIISYKKKVFKQHDRSRDKTVNVNVTEPIKGRGRMKLLIDNRHYIIGGMFGFLIGLMVAQVIYP